MIHESKFNERRVKKNEGGRKRQERERIINKLHTVVLILPFFKK